MDGGNRRKERGRVSKAKQENYVTNKKYNKLGENATGFSCIGKKGSFESKMGYRKMHPMAAGVFLNTVDGIRRSIGYRMMRKTTCEWMNESR